MDAFWYADVKDPDGCYYWSTPYFCSKTDLIAFLLDSGIGIDQVQIYFD